MSELESLKKIRAGLKGTMTRLLTYVSGITNVSDEAIDQFQVRAQRAQSTFETFLDIEKQIFRCDAKEESNLATFEDNYFSVIASLNGWIRKKSITEAISVGSHNNTTLNSTQSASIEVKLPKINITPFTGAYKDWQTFFDLFSTTIHDKDYLSSAQKFQYLKSLLKGEAERFLRNTNITEANYTEALQKLMQRYDRKRHTVNAHIDSFLKQPNITSATAANVRSLLDTADEAIRGLKCLGQKAEARDPWLIYVLLGKLDMETQTLWSQYETADKDFPTLAEFFNFLEVRTDALETMNSYITNKRTAAASHASKPQKTNLFATTGIIVSCPLCKSDSHKLFECDQFKAKTVAEREIVIKGENRCFNCLNFNHSVYNCRSRARCRECHKKHHTLLHSEEKRRESSLAASKQTSSSSTTTVALVNANDATGLGFSSESQVILPTAMVEVKGGDGYGILCRALLDSSSQESFITEDCAQKLGLKRTNGRLIMKGLGDMKLGQSRGRIFLEILVTDNKPHKLKIEAYVVPKIAAKIPSKEFDTSDWYQLSGLKLADPRFNRHSTIELLLGTEVYYAVTGGSRINLRNNLIAEETAFGWVIAGRCLEQEQQSASCFSIMLDIDDSLRKLWEIEAIPTRSTLSEEEIKCERWFVQYTERSANGQFICRLPFRDEPSKLGSTLWLAIKRQKAMERRFERDAQFKELYVAFMNEYEKLGHMVQIGPDDIHRYYLPHHGVLKEASSTTKLRVVFDASAKSTSGVSLNNILCVGPVIQSSLLDILLRFRQHKFVLTGDLEKMYRQILMAKEDCKVQNIVWRSDVSKPMCHYQLKTLTYGTAPASFIATRCLKELSQQNVKSSPAAARVIDRDMYVDDLMTGADSKEELMKLKNEIINILAPANFNLRNQVKPIAEYPNTTKLLGLAWNPQTDRFYFVAQFEARIKHTKRTLLSEASKTFDPLGWLAPMIVRIKILFQTLWMQKIEWDDELPPDVQHKWEEIRGDLRQLSDIKIPRWLGSSRNMQLHGFCDASQWAYAAAVYCRCERDGVIETHLIASKTKVSPIKQISIPRLELSGAVLLSKLMLIIMAALDLEIDRVVCWTDSKIVLDWLSAHPRKWPVFVANRTAEILDNFRREQWSHVMSADNPADCASCGITAAELVNHSLWWTGPDWLRAAESDWPRQEQSYNTNEEVKSGAAVFHVSIANELMEEIINKFSSFRKMSRVLAIIRRFISNAKAKKQQLMRGQILPAEIKEAENFIYKYVQEVHFSTEIEKLKNQLPVSKQSILKSLNPFIDAYGIVRVGGRIGKSLAPFCTKHPIILHNKSPIIVPIITDYHHRYYHAGNGLMLSLLRQQLWIIRAKDVIKSPLRKCVQCIKQRPRLETQIMDDLPAERVQYNHAFTNVSVDYAGPFKVTPVRRRGQQSLKAYVCIFVCLGTRAVHIEYVGSLTTESFLAALSRFTDRRGLCKTIYSDNGFNFVGAYRHLSDLFTFINKNKADISFALSRKEISWHFNPPGAPHMNGLAEAAVKSTKTHMKRVIGDTILSIEEFSTLLSGIESVLNARPLCVVSSNDIEYLTPAHFILGRALHNLPDTNPDDFKLAPASRWDLIKKLRHHFWIRWHRDYLITLQKRNKWKEQKSNLGINDIVILKNENMASINWALGKITELHPGSDGCVRVVSIKTSTGIIKRPVHKLCKLPIN